MRQPDEAVPENPDAGFSSRRRELEREDHARRWLYLTQIGEDSADCLSAADSTSSVERSFQFGEYIVVQCATRSANAADLDQ